VPTIEVVTADQVSVLLDIVDALRQFAIEESSGTPNKGPLDGGVVAAASATLINTLARLDDLLAEKSRWSATAAVDLCAEITKTQQLQQKFLTQQLLSAREVTRKSFQLRPALFHYKNEFLAVYTDAITDQKIVGIGDTPEEALVDFDHAFSRPASGQHQIQVEVTEPVPATPLTVKPTKKPKAKK